MGKYGRKSGRLRLSRRLIVFTEGETERDYLDRYRQKLGLSEEVVFVKKAKGGDPLSVLQELKVEIERRKSKGTFFEQAGDFGYVVCDIDEHCHNEIMINKLNQCWQEIQNVAYLKSGFSNPCVEFWLNLHYEDVFYSHDRFKARRLLKQKPGFEDYDKRVDKQMFENLMNNLNVARENAAQVLGRTVENSDEGVLSPQLNPYTEVQDLLGVIEEIATKIKKKSNSR